MVLDRDYPMTRRGVVILVVGLIVMAVLGAALFGGYLPGLHPTFTLPSTRVIGGHTYNVLETPLRTPFGANSTGPWNVTFENVSFYLWLSNWYSATGGIVHGNGTEANGTTYWFVLGNLLPNGTRTMLYVSPDLAFGVYWLGGIIGGFYVQLLVLSHASPTVTTGAPGPFTYMA
jgi:hypothetical protein